MLTFHQRGYLVKTSSYVWVGRFWRKICNLSQTRRALHMKNLKIAVIATNGFEESELTETVEALKNAGFETDIIAPQGAAQGGKIQAFRHQEPSVQVAITKTLDEVHPEDYDGLLLPGGALNADTLRADQKVLDFVKLFDSSQKPIAAICHAPWILISAGIAEGRILTSYFTIRDDLKNAGVNWVDQSVVVDKNIVTSRMPDDIAAFNREMIKLFSRAGASVVNIAESA
jgi:protease I